MKNYLRKQDKLADAPGMTYKGEETYGTSIGGCCSLFASIFVAIYFIVILTNFFITPNFNSEIETLYHMPTFSEGYVMTPLDLIPAVQVFDINDPNNIKINDVNGTVTWKY